MNYDPDTAPDSAVWIAMDDSEKIAVISDYHKRARIKLPNLKLHAAIHAVVENQIAMGDTTEAKRTIDRLMDEGLDQHDALHAIGSILAGQIHQILTNRTEADMESYSRNLQQLTAQNRKDSGQ